jgi:hypothetical protein
MQTRRRRLVFLLGKHFFQAIARSLACLQSVQHLLLVLSLSLYHPAIENLANLLGVNAVRQRSADRDFVRVVPHLQNHKPQKNTGRGVHGRCH